ncbi:unnamed protein product [Ectocarpus sp. 6 AP-2014]
MAIIKASLPTVLALAVGILDVLGKAFGERGGVPPTLPFVAVDVGLRRDNGTFSEEWMDQFSSDAVGCAGSAKDPYLWRPAGYGSNINNMLLVWANAILEGRNDASVITQTGRYFSRTTCDVESNGVETRGGWNCIFAAVPHLCAFDSDKDWNRFNNRHHVSANDMKKGGGLKDITVIRKRRTSTEQSLAALGYSMLEVMAMLHNLLHTHIQPWFKADVQAILDEPDIAAMRSGKYVGLHIRRTDKANEVQPVKTKAYLAKAVNYLASPTNDMAATNITGIWVSSDDEAVFDEVKQLASEFFPGIAPSAVLYVTGGKPVQLMRGAADRNSYEAMVYLRAELEMLAGSAVFSGTFSSNVGRMVALMRKTLDMPDESAVSVDFPAWFAGRQRHRRE